MQRSQSRGFVLLTVISITIIILAILGAYSTLTTIDQNVSLSIQDSNNGFFAAEAGLNVRADTVRTIFQGFNRPTGTSPTGDPPCLGGDTGSGDFQCITYNIGNFDVSTYVVEQIPPSPEPYPREIVIPSGEDFAGLNAQEYRYSAIAQATRLDDQPQAILEMVFRSRLVPLFQFAVFYDNDLEIFPGPPMNLAGPIHTNSNLFMGAGARLDIDGGISSAGDFFMGRKHRNSDGGICSSNGGRPVVLAGNATELRCNGGDRRRFTDANINNVGATNLISPNRARLEVPGVDTFAPVPGNEYFDLADLRLALNLNTTPPQIEVRTVANTVDAILTPRLENCPGSVLTPNTDVLDVGYTHLYERTAVSYQPPPLPAIWNGGRIPGDNNARQNQLNTIVEQHMQATGFAGPPPFYDAREQRFMNLMNVNVGALLNCIQADNSLIGGEPLNTTGEGGLVFHLTVDGPNSGGQNNYGIRLVNGQSLTSSNLPLQTGACATTGQPCGLTIVSDQSVYVQGHYNAPLGTTGAWDAVNGQPDRIPASIIADTLSVVSGNWDDRLSFNFRFSVANTGNPFRVASSNPFFQGRRTATDTEYNMAILAGTESSCNLEGAPCNGTYNGGFENFPRMLEFWGAGTQMRYRGSIVSLDNPQTKNTLNEGRPQFRDPPNRLWAFDTRFRRAENLPPLSPRFVYLVQELFVREFEQ